MQGEENVGTKFTHEIKRFKIVYTQCKKNQKLVTQKGETLRNIYTLAAFLEKKFTRKVRKNGGKCTFLPKKSYHMR